jgi:hypothetical protein
VELLLPAPRQRPGGRRGVRGRRRRGRVVDLTPESVVVEVTGTEAEIDGFVAMVRTYGIKELVRTGAVVMSRGSGSIEEALKR